MSVLIESRTAIWLCRLVIVAYGALIFWALDGMAANWSETVRLLDSEAMCSAAPLKCGLINHIIDLVIPFNIMELAIISEVAVQWRYRHYVRAGAAAACIGHLVVNYVLIQIGYYL